MPDDTTIPLDIAVAGSEAITHYRSQVAALLATGESVADASASVLDQWNAIHGPHLRAMNALPVAEVPVSLDALRNRLAQIQRNIPLFDEHHHFMGSVGSGTHLSTHLTHASTHSIKTTQKVSRTITLLSKPQPLTILNTIGSEPFTLNVAGPPNLQSLMRYYGPEQLSQVLDGYSYSRLKDAAAHYGVKPGKTKDETIARLYQHATGEKITIQREGTKATPVTDLHATSARLQLRALTAEAAHKAEQQAHAATKQQLAQLQREHAKLQAENARLTATKTATKAAKALQQETKLTPIAGIAGREINPAAVLDPVFLRTLYGDDQLEAALSRHSFANLKAAFTLPAFRDLKPGKTIAATRQILMQRARELPLMPHTPLVPTSA